MLVISISSGVILHISQCSKPLPLMCTLFLVVNGYRWIRELFMLSKYEQCTSTVRLSICL